jgi:hypothetical protein
VLNDLMMATQALLQSFSENDSGYAIAWLAYSGALLLACHIWWRMTRVLPTFTIRALCRGALVVLLIVPTPVATEAVWFCPGFMALIMHLINGEQAPVTQLLSIYQMWLSVMAALVVIWSIVHHFQSKARRE